MVPQFLKKRNRSAWEIRGEFPKNIIEPLQQTGCKPALPKGGEKVEPLYQQYAQLVCRSLLSACREGVPADCFLYAV